MEVNPLKVMKSLIPPEVCVNQACWVRKEYMSKDPHAVCTGQLFSAHQVDVAGY